MIPTEIAQTHVDEALRQIDPDAVPPEWQSSPYDLEHAGRRYPPRYVLSLAARVATGRALAPAEIESDDAVRVVLGRLGYRVVERPTADDDSGVSAAEVRAQVEKWYPDSAVRRACLGWLADAIERGSREGPARWVVTFRRNPVRVRLSVGQTMVCELRADRVWVPLDAATLAAADRQAVAAIARPGSWEFTILRDVDTFEVPPARLAAVRTHLEPAFARFVARAAQTVSRRTSFFHAYAPAVLAYLEGELGRSLPRPDYRDERASIPASRVDPATLRAAFASFRADPCEAFRVAMRRHRAAQIRALLSDPDRIDVATFDREVWPVETETRLDGVDITGEFINASRPLTPDRAAELGRALAAGRIELHGNYVWGSATRVFGAMVKDPDERTRLIREALRVLNDPALAPLEKARRLIDGVKGFGRNSATGLAMLFHPDRIALCNEVSRTVLQQLGYAIGSLDEFEQSAAALREALEVDDAIEVDWFLYLVNAGRYRVLPEPSPAGAAGAGVSDAPQYMKVAPGDGAQFWKECLASGTICVGWDELGDLRAYATREELGQAFEEHYSDQYKGHRPALARAANELWAFRQLRPGDRVIANQGQRRVLAVGEVVAPGYGWDAARAQYRHTVRVRWDTSLAREIPQQHAWLRTIALLSRDQFDELFAPPSPAAPAAPIEAAPPYVEPTLAQIEEFVEGQGLRIDGRLLRRYHLSLRVRRFVILAGVSGTGKTWLAQAYARAVHAEHALVPVAPNWTSNEDLLGFRSPLDDRYRETSVSRFLRRAAAEYEAARAAGRPPRPFHLVLDEMNLARVEYYFAKFLSAMEVLQREEATTLELADGDSVVLGPNLAFVGTVNVDETTHGFADKVYDRAQLIELPAPRALLEAHVGDAVCGPALLAVWDAVAAAAPFAFRVVDDVLEYVKDAVGLGVPWQEALDEQVLQKVLPKLKGTDVVVGEALDQLTRWAGTDFPLTGARATRMLEGFRRHGLASYF